MTRSIDAARGSKQNLARRGEDCRWARIVPLDPAVFDVAQREALRQSLEFLEQASEDELRDYLTALQDMLSGGAEGEADRGGGERHVESPPASGKRETNGGTGAARAPSHAAPLVDALRELAAEHERHAAAIADLHHRMVELTNNEEIHHHLDQPPGHYQNQLRLRLFTAPEHRPVQNHALSADH
jgi:hypothetical protein